MTSPTRRRPLRHFARSGLYLEWLEDRTLLSDSSIPAVLVLDPSSSGALNVSGNGSVVVLGGGSVVSDSASPQAAKALVRDSQILGG
jgi:hypothetical protein